MGSTALRLVCFDLGGVVLRICRNWREGCAAAGLDERDPAAWRQSGPARQALLIDHQTGRIDGPTFAAMVSELTGGLYSPAEILGIHHAWLLGQHRGMGAIMERVHRGGLDTAALSNTNHEHWVRMGEFPAVMRIRHLFASHRLGLHKPDPSFYHRLERQLGYAGSEILFFDDTQENVAAAQRLGWRAELIDPAASPAAQIAAVLGANGVGD